VGGADQHGCDPSAPAGSGHGRRDRVLHRRPGGVPRRGPAAAYFGPRSARPLGAALACGVIYGLTACLLKEVPDTLPQGFSDPSRQWPLYALIILAPAGYLLNQNAFQAGTHIGTGPFPSRHCGAVGSGRDIGPVGG
jgi:hypothetical protein